MTTMYGNCRQKDFFWGALVGGILGTLSTLLFTTKKGRQIQQQITEAYEGIEDSVKTSIKEFLPINTNIHNINFQNFK